MTPKQKAEELVIKFLRQYCNDEGEVVIHDNTIVTRKNQFGLGYFANCALIAASEVCDAMWDQMADKDRIIYWEDVKHEIEKL